ncbi:MAG: PAS domain S-box protein [Peptococcaceae bacterium]|nr:PAS domain S-box protein [Peptococcaceae bacterium]
MNRQIHAQIIRTSINLKKLLVYLIFACIVLGAIYIFATWKIYVQNSEEKVKVLAEAAAAFVSRDSLSQLQSEARHSETYAYEQLKNSLLLFKQQNIEVNTAYLYTQWDGQIQLVLDSEQFFSEDYSPFEQLYEQAGSELLQPFIDGKTRLVGPITDSKGTWINTLAPIKDVFTGEVKAVLGVSYSALLANKESVKHVRHAIIVVLSVLMLLLVLYHIVLKNETLKSLKFKLKESEALYRAVFDNASVGIAVLRNYEMFVEMNNMFTKIMGRSKEEMKGMSWLSLTAPDDWAADMEMFSRLKAGEIKDYSMEKRIVKPDGSTIWVNMDITVLQQSDRSDLTHLCLVQDINDRKLTEQALRESERSKSVLLSHLPGMAYRCCYDKNWTMEFLSDGCLELTGYNPESLINNKEIAYSELILPEYRDPIWQEWKRVLALREQFKYEYEIVTAQGEKKWVWEIGQGIFDENESLISLEGIVIDITQSKRNQMQIQYLNDHDVMTGLYNRIYYEKAKNELDKEEYLPLSVIISDINGVRLVNDAFGYHEGDRLIMETAKIIQACCRDKDIVARTGGDEFTILMPNTSREQAYQFVEKITQACEDYNNRTADKANSISLSIGLGTKQYSIENIRMIEREAEEYMYKHKLLEQESHHSAILSSIMATMYAKSQETKEHANRLATLSKMIGEELNLQQKSMDELELFAMLHDIGKIGIDDRILNKPGKLNDKEWIAMKKHSEMGYRITMSSPELQSIAYYILSHHERWDGKGYPQGLKGEEIPLLSRILAVADAYDAMTEDRIYRKAMRRDQAIEEIKKNAGTQFDPCIVEIFTEKVYDKLCSKK